MDKPRTTNIKHHVDPMRFPNIQGQYETKAKKAFNVGQLFEDIVKTMVDIIKEK